MRNTSTFLFTPLALAVSSLLTTFPVAVLAQAAEQNASSVPLSSKAVPFVEQLLVDVSQGIAPADGQSPISITVSIADKNNQLVSTPVLVTLEVSGGRLLLPNARTDELGPGAADLDPFTPGTQVLIENGKLTLQLLAPIQPQDVNIRITAGDKVAIGMVSFVPALRDWIASGLIEGVIALRRTKNESDITPARMNDGFEEQLNQWSRTFNENSANKGTAAARTAFFLKGTISGKTLLTTSYDSDKETRARMLRDIKAEELYPVYGDASLKTFEAQSSSKLYVRVDNGKHYALYGDFNTGDGFSQLTGGSATAFSPAPIKQRDLGAYNRSFTGVRGHWQTDQIIANAFAARDSLSQRVEEYAGNGTSGPYSVTHNDAIENTEKVELIVRDRNNPGRILEIRLLQRFVDYTFEPFAGRLLFSAPIQTTDAQGNSQSIRITYEIDQGGEKFWVTGADVQLKLSPSIELGGSLVQDNNPQVLTTDIERQLKQLMSANVGIQLTPSTRLVVEGARTDNNTVFNDVSGNAGRIEMSANSGSDQRWNAQAYVAKAGEDFYNPSASLNQGRGEAVVKGQFNLSPATTLKAEVTQSIDDQTGADRKGAYVGADIKLNERITALVGLRKSQDNGSGLYAPATGSIGSNGSGSLYDGTGLSPSSGGLFGTGVGPANPGLGQIPQLTTQNGSALDATTLVLGIRSQVAKNVVLGLEGETSVEGDKAHRVAATAAWQIAERTALNARYETQTGLGSFYDRADKSNAFVLGVTNTYMLQGLGAGGSGVETQLFSEYRLRDAIGGREAQLASGVRNSFDVAQGLRAVIGLERLKLLSGTTQPATALATGLDYTGSELWKGSARLEWRRADATDVAQRSDSLLNTLLLARKLSANWTLLTRNYYASTDSEAIPGKQMQDRFQLGFAYRPVDQNRFDALGKVEYKIEKNTELINDEEDRKVWVASLHGNWHPSRPWWISGRIAAKNVDEKLEGVADKFNAVLVGGRVIYDITERWDLGFLASLLSGQGNRQKALGGEVGYALRQNLWVSAGYNWSGFTDRDLTGQEYTAQGPYLRMRFKFDETLGLASNPLKP